MLRLTSAWTERHTAVASLLVLSSTASLAGLVDGGWVPGAVGAAVGVTALVALALDAWGGAVVGLVAAAGLVALRRALDEWTLRDFAPAAIEATALIAVGCAAGLAGRRLRGNSTTGSGMSSMWQPVYGSLGLLGHEAATARLEDEVERSERTQRPLCLALVDIWLIDPDLPPAGRDAALRAAARLVENRARDHDLPFALGPERLGIVIVDAPMRVAWDLIGHLLTSVQTATFVFGEERAPRRLADTVELNVGIAQHRLGEGWEPLLDEAVSAVDRARDETATDGAVAPTSPATSAGTSTGRGDRS